MQGFVAFFLSSPRLGFLKRCDQAWVSLLIVSHTRRRATLQQPYAGDWKYDNHKAVFTRPVRCFFTAGLWIIPHIMLFFNFRIHLRLFLHPFLFWPVASPLPFLFVIFKEHSAGNYSHSVAISPPSEYTDCCAGCRRLCCMFQEWVSAGVLKRIRLRPLCILNCTSINPNCVVNS